MHTYTDVDDTLMVEAQKAFGLSPKLEEAPRLMIRLRSQLAVDSAFWGNTAGAAIFHGAAKGKEEGGVSTVLPWIDPSF